MSSSQLSKQEVDQDGPIRKEVSDWYSNKQPITSGSPSGYCYLLNFIFLLF